MYLVFRCSRCGRHLYAEAGAKSRSCPCGKRVDLKKAVILAKAEDAAAAGDAVRALQMKEGGPTGFRRWA